MDDQTKRSGHGLEDTVRQHETGTEPAATGRHTTHSDSAQLPDYPELSSIDPAHYVRLRELASGGMGRIWIARDRRLGRTVAVKETLVAARAVAQRFEREARITSRLQHPSIVNVLEAGRWPDGEPFYAMTLVPGRSLDEVVAEARTLEQRLALLPNVLAVADAMAYAHGQGVIHRDLKPRNVLVGEFGQTVVIDWGLAKDFNDASPDSFDDTLRGNAAETMVGEVLGTPAYMPPEQALGRPVDARADVYSIGALLDHVLSGRPPYVGTSARQVLELVRQGPPRPLAERQPELPPELLAIVSRAMARDEAERYPSARELAEDLRRFQTGQLVGAHRYSTAALVRRWLARHRASVITAAVAAALLVTMGALSVRRIVAAQHLAEAQAKRANESRADAEDLLGFMLTDLRTRLLPLGRLDVLDQVSQKAVAYYERRGEDLDDAEFDARVLTRRTRGDVLAAQGRSAEALTEYRAALALAQALVRRTPANDARLQASAAAMSRVAEVLREQGETSEALELYTASFALSSALAARHPDDRLLQRDVSIIHLGRGATLARRGDSPGALADYRAALAVSEKLAADEPANTVWQRDISVAQDAIGQELSAHGDSRSALPFFKASSATTTALLAKDPSNVHLLADLSIAQDHLGDALLRDGDTAGALARFTEGLRIRKMLTERDSTRIKWLRDLTVSYDAVVDVLRQQGKYAEAATQARASVAISEQLLARDPTSVSRRDDLAIGHLTAGDVLIDAGDAAGALASYRAALALAEANVAQEPENHDVGQSALLAHRGVGEALHLLKQEAAALEHLRAAKTMALSLIQQQPDSPDRKLELAVIERDLSRALLSIHKPAEAATHARAALELAQALAEEDPSAVAFQESLARSHETLGDSFVVLGDTAGARAEYEAAFDVAQSLAAKDPANLSRSQPIVQLKRKLAKVSAKR